MKSITQRARAISEELRRRRARLPWAELEAEARRQGCSPADIFFDRAGRMPEGEGVAPDTRVALEEVEPYKRREPNKSSLRASSEGREMD